MEQTPLTPAERRAAMLAEMTRKMEEMLAEPVLEETDPDSSVAFVFELIRMARALEFHLAQVARVHDMTAMQARFAWIIAAGAGAIPLQNIQVALGLSQSGVSRMLLRMSARDLVEYGAGYDPRSATVRLTAHGKAQWACLRDALATVAEELTDAVGTKASKRFREQAGEVTTLDERHRYFEALKNPLSILS